MFENCNYYCGQCYPNSEIRTMEGIWDISSESDGRKCNINWYLCKECEGLIRLHSENDSYAIGSVINIK